ncbi:MAG: hypothetical protein AAGI50_07880 [Pseudomonadota bacterium]
MQGDLEPPALSRRAKNRIVREQYSAFQLRFMLRTFLAGLAIYGLVRAIDHRLLYFQSANFEIVISTIWLFNMLLYGHCCISILAGRRNWFTRTTLDKIDTRMAQEMRWQTAARSGGKD